MNYEPTPKGGNAERGTLMVAVAVLIILLSGVSIAFLEEGMGERRSVNLYEQSLQALEVAEAGLARAEMELLSQTDPGGDGLGTLKGNHFRGEYETVGVPDPLATMEWVVVSTGRHGLGVRRVEAGIRVRPRGWFTRGLYARDQLIVNGDLSTDGFDSRLGTYVSQAVNIDAAGNYALGEGHVGSNAIINAVGTAATIRGDAIPGPFHTVQTSGSPTIWGSTTPRVTELELQEPPYVEFEDAWATNDNGSLAAAVYDAGTMALNARAKQDVILTGGTYFFSSISITAHARIIVKGPSKIYVTGPVDIGGGGLINDSGVAANFQLYAHPHPLPPDTIQPDADVKITGGAEAYMVVYAPSRPVELRGNTDFYGAVVGEMISVSGNASFHYDLALQDVRRISGFTLQRLFWREVSGPPR
ncbi:MAG: DUF7305 domain-containing protein [Planctomycetota bacterium]|jgi:hypothetical protein